MEVVHLERTGTPVNADIQNGFLPDGSLAKLKCDGIISALNRSAMPFNNHALPMYAIRDWHRPNFTVIDARHFNRHFRHSRCLFDFSSRQATNVKPVPDIIKTFYPYHSR
jgi:nicotinamidase-related amidase